MRQYLARCVELLREQTETSCTCYPSERQHKGLIMKNYQILNVTREFITQGNIRVGRHINGFLPESTVGSANKKNGKGIDITLLLSGMGREIKTDIPCDKKIFRIRTPIKDFVRHHNLQCGDKVYLEKIIRRDVQ